MSESTEYQRGYRDGIETFRKQMTILQQRMEFAVKKLSVACIFNHPNRKPRPGITLWLVLDTGMVTEGVYLNGKYISMAGCECDPVLWAKVPSMVLHLTGSPGEEKPKLK